MARRDVGKAYLDEILGLLPEDDRKIVSEKLAKDEVLDRVGDAVMRQQDYSKQTGELAQEKAALLAKHKELEGWLTEQKTYLDDYRAIKPEYDKLKAGGGGGGDDREDPPVGLPKEVLARIDKTEAELAETKKQLGLAMAEAPGLMIELHKLDRRHKKEFNEELDMDDLAQFAASKNINVREAYVQKYGERLVEVEKKRRDDEIKAAEQRGRDAAMREVRSQMPHIVDNTQEPSTLQGLKAEGGRRAGVAAAVEAFHEAHR